MTNYRLKPDEFVIMQKEEGISFVEKVKDLRLEEIVLTNQCLLLVTSMRQGFIKRSTAVRRCELKKLAVKDGIPQAVVSKVKGGWWLQAPFDGDPVQIKFDERERRAANRWAEGIRAATSGDLAAINTRDEVLPDEIANLIDDAKSMFGAVFPINPAKNSSFQQTQRTTVKCIGCHAPLTARKGSTVSCPYCDTTQTV